MNINPTLAEKPFYQKLAYILIILISLVYVSIIAKEILSPLIFSLLFSILLLPLANFFERKLKFPRSAAAGLSVVILLITISLLFYAIGSQLSSLAKDWPQFKEQLTITFNNLQQWVENTFHIQAEKQMNYVNSATSNILDKSTSVIGSAVASFSSILLFLVFVMIDTFFLLFYRRLLVTFIVNVFKKENAHKVYDIIAQVEYIINRYILGLLLEMGIVATICCISFWLIGIKYSMLLGLITGVFNVIPYIGIFSALLLSTLITFATAAGTTKILLVVITIILLHLIDSNVLLPLIVGSKVKINAFITLLGVIIGEKIWGIAGMFLSIPVIAIVKIIFDRIESLQPWGLLLGEEKNMTEKKQIINKLKRKRTAVP